MDRLLEVMQVDLPALSAAADDLLATDDHVRDVLKESLAQFFPTVQVDRDRFPALETARARFVLCTRRMYEAHRDDISRATITSRPTRRSNVLFTQQKKGACRSPHLS